MSDKPASISVWVRYENDNTLPGTALFAVADSHWVNRISVHVDGNDYLMADEAAAQVAAFILANVSAADREVALLTVRSAVVMRGEESLVLQDATAKRVAEVRETVEDARIAYATGYADAVEDNESRGPFYSGSGEW
jgi:hypothetical protein